jgi:hypothetical protein
MLSRNVLKLRILLTSEESFELDGPPCMAGVKAKESFDGVLAKRRLRIASEGRQNTFC